MSALCKKLSLVLLASMCLACSGTQGAAPASAITSAGGEGYVKGVVYGVPFEVEIGLEVVDVTGEDPAYCPWVFVEVLGLRLFGTLPIPDLPEVCFVERPAITFGVPTYEAKPERD